MVYQWYLKVRLEFLKNFELFSSGIEVVSANFFGKYLKFWNPFRSIFNMVAGNLDLKPLIMISRLEAYLKFGGGFGLSPNFR